MVSIIIPCRNEEKFIAGCLDSVIANDYPKDKLEVLVIDGMSDDETREIIGRYTKQYPFIKLLDNLKKIVPYALNIGIRSAKGEIIMRMDAHATYEKDYISKCVKYLDEYNADNVGGIWKIIPRKDTFTGSAIALVLSCPFGIGNAYYRFVDKEPRWVDTVPFFCHKKGVFEKIGLFNENLIYSQDMEFNVRLKKAGGKILLAPDIISYYYTRSDFRSFCKHNWRNGVWAIYPIKFTNYLPVKLRHLVPLIFVSGLIITFVLSFSIPVSLWLFLLVVFSYLLINIYFSSKIAIREKDFGYLFIMPVIFVSLHVTYGLGSLWGLLNVIVSKQFHSVIKK